MFGAKALLRGQGFTMEAERVHAPGNDAISVTVVPEKFDGSGPDTMGAVRYVVAIEDWRRFQKLIEAL